MKQTDLGILLNRTSYSESSLILTFYTQEEGIQKFIFQGGKKKNNNLFPLNICELTFYKRPDSDLRKLTQTDSLLPLNSIISNPIKSIIAFFLVDVIRHSLKTNEKEEKLFTFLQEKIIELDKTEETSNFPLLFLSEFTSFLGIQPSINDDNILYFSYNEGEFHSDYRIGEWSEEGENVIHLYNLFQLNEVNQKHRKKLLDILLQYYKLHIPHFNVEKSLDVIRDVLN